MTGILPTTRSQRAASAARSNRQMTSSKPLDQHSRTKQISHESNSSFFTTATAVSSAYGGEEHVVVDAHRLKSFSSSKSKRASFVAALPKIEGPPEETPVQVVYRFLQLREHGHLEAAAALLDETVQVSYPGLPFCKSAAEYVVMTQKTRSPAFLWQVLQKGAHENQVMRRGRLANTNEAVIEVFELHPSTDDDDDDGSSLVIGAMYLRKAPRQWTTLFGSLRRKGRGYTTATNSQQQSESSKRLQREMLEGDISEEEYYFDSSSEEQTLLQANTK